MDIGNGSVIPQHLAPGRFIHFILIPMTTLLVGNIYSFHATQYAAWHGVTLKSMTPATHATLAVCRVMNTILHASDTGITTEPQFDNGIQVECFFNQTLSESYSCLKAQGTDLAFFIQQSGQPRTTWTSCNASRSKTNPEVPSIGYMPIIQAHA